MKINSNSRHNFNKLYNKSCIVNRIDLKCWKSTQQSPKITKEVIWVGNLTYKYLNYIFFFGNKNPAFINIGYCIVQLNIFHK